MEMLKYIFSGLVVISGFVEIAPIKINPISSALKWIGSKLTQELNDKIKQQEERQRTEMEKLGKDIESLKEDMRSVKLQQAQDEVDLIRTEILQFGYSLRKKEKHTKSQFEQIITLKTKYDHIIEKYELDNGVLELEYEFIERIYKKCQDEGTFL